MYSLLGLLAPLVAAAQNSYEMRDRPATANVYAQQQIDLLAGFEATADGFEAKIKLPEATAGRWSARVIQSFLNSTHAS